MTEGAPVRVGIVGFGLSGSAFHAPFVVAQPELELAAVVTRDEGRAAAARRLAPGVQVVGSFEELLPLVDLVVIASPTGLHAAQVRTAIEAGVATIVDKPLATNAGDAEGLVRLAADAGVPLTVFQNRRYDDDLTFLRGLLDADALGEVRRFESRFEWWKPGGGAAWKSQASPAEGGGLLLDLGTHLVDQALGLFGPVERVELAQLEARSGGPAEDDAFVALRHTSGVLTHLWMSSHAGLRGPRFHVLGSRGAVDVVGLDPQEPLLRAGVGPLAPEYLADARSATVFDGEATTTVPIPRTSYLAYYDAVADWMLRGGPAPVDPADAVRVLEVLDAVRAAADRAPRP